MTVDARCREVRVELSARLDDEVDAATARALDAHLDHCAACRAHARRLENVRRLLRARPAEPVPDLSEQILARVRSTPRPGRWRAGAGWTRHVRVAAIAAAVTALLLGVSLPFTDRRADVAAADEIARAVRSAARALRSYHATYEISERGWHQAVGVRRFEASVSFRAPERFRLDVRDLTRYPAGNWPRNDVSLVSTPRRWWIEEPSTCPPGALPVCPVTTETRSLVRRQPFDGTSSLPTDIIVPLETLTGARGYLARPATALGRPAYRIRLPFRQAAPVVLALQAGGSWRTFDPFDSVELWIDRRTWFPLRVEVRPRAGGPSLLTVRATGFSTSPSDAPARAFRVPRSALAKDGGFTPRPASRLRYPRPRFVAGLSPYRSGVSTGGREVRSYTDGLTWLRVTYARSRAAVVPFGSSSEEIAFGDGSYAYYEPATSTSAVESHKRRVDVYGRRVHVHIESNLERADVLRVARSLDVRGRAVRLVVRRGGGWIRPLRPDDVARFPFFHRPDYLPEGYEPSAAFVSRARDGRLTVSVLYRSPEAEFDGFGIRITQARPVRMLPPTSESFRSFRVGHRQVRWAPWRGELEWRDGVVYRAVAAPSFGRAVAAKIAASL